MGSERIRWSADFRLHPKKSTRPGRAGELDWFYSLKDSLLLRDSADPSYKPDWGSWAAVDRTEVQDASAGLEVDKFDPLIVGPWMDLWDIEPHQEGKPNAHVERYLALPQEQRDPQGYIDQGN